MWKIYRIVDSNILKPTVLGEASAILDRISTEESNEIVDLLYPKNKNLTPLEYGLLFIRGLINNNYFDFRAFIKTLHNG